MVRSTTHERVDMSVGVVANNLSMLNPYYTLGEVENLLQPGFDVVRCQRLVPVWRSLAGACEEQRAVAVGLNGTALKDEIRVVPPGHRRRLRSNRGAR